jgi:RTA1 like protein
VLWVVPPKFQTAKHLWLPSRYITPVFVGCDVFSFFVQIIGGSMLAGANTASKLTTGKNVILVGLAIQMITFGFFVLASIRFSFFLRKTLQGVPLPAERNWRLFLRIINIASVIILARTIMRFIEFVSGVNNYLSEHEWFFYIFDSTLMWLVAAAFAACHPGYFLPYLAIRRKHKEFSKHAEGGFAGRFARGSTRIAIPSEENSRTMDMSGEY